MHIRFQTPVADKKDPALPIDTLQNEKDLLAALDARPHDLLDLLASWEKHPALCEEIFIFAMRSILENLPKTQHDNSQKSKISDRVYYSLYRHFLNISDGERAEACINKLSNQFTSYKLSDFSSLPPDIRNKAHQAIFIKLHSAKHYELALLFLNNINDYRLLEFCNIFQYFDAYDPQQTNIALYTLKKSLLNNLSKQEHFHSSPDFYNKVLREVAHLNDPNEEIRFKFLSIIQLFNDYLHVREERKKIHPWRIWVGDKLRQNLHVELKILAKHSELERTTEHTRERWRELYRTFNAFLYRWRAQLAGDNIAQVFEDTSTQLQAIHRKIQMLQAPIRTNTFTL